MIQPLLDRWSRPVFQPAAEQPIKSPSRRVAGVGLITFLLAVMPLAAQVVTIDTKTGTVTNASTGHAGTVDRRYQQIEPTHVALKPSELDPRTRLDLLRALQAEQGFAMRPFPRGHKGLTLVANGKLIPAGEDYLTMVTEAGLSAKPGDRVVLTDIKFDRSKIVFDLNGGPDRKHRFLRHIQIGAGPDVMNSVVQTNDPDPVGARLTLVFQKGVPELTPTDVKALLTPLISFDVKTPVQAFTDTLPPKLKQAILDHKVLVGMSVDMVLFAKGQPEIKSREMDGQMPFEEWIYGKPPKDVEFVRINGNRVIRVEIAKTGETPVVFTKDEVEGLMRTDGTPLEEAKADPRTIKEGDVQRDPNTQAPAPSPSLRKPGETLPADDKSGQRVGDMRPVQFPKPKPDDQSGQQPDAAPPAGSAPADGTGSSQPAAPPANTQPATPPDASQPAPAKPQQWASSSRNN